MKLANTFAAAAAVSLAFASLTACTAAPPPEASSGVCDTSASDAGIAAYVESGVALGEGPYGERSADIADLELTSEQVNEIKALRLTAGISMHFSGDTWSNAQIAGLTSEFERLGIEIVAQTSADAEVTKQFSDIESITARKPDILVAIPSLDVTALAPAFERATDAEIKVVFMDNPAAGMEPGDYVSVVASDYYGYGVINAYQLAAAICGEGEIGVLRHGAKAPNNVQALEGFVTTIEEDFPDIDIVEEADILGPDFSGEGESNVNSMLAEHPDLAGVWCFFDLPCEGAINAARAAGRDSLPMTMGGLGVNVAVQMASSDDFVIAIGSVQPYQQGVLEARLGALALLGEETPPYVSLPAIPVDAKNLEMQWKAVYDEPLPPAIVEALKG
ncbi:substrate-binding domain-containing protein [Microbacterium murale]|uniref:Sugar ABC transporter substrate-binding protein n=1 Tax=Microbacterium murale TaxID=1081040 RepID=A0ABQ1RKX8_9MICO|nr:substrate-binding domain-containing protein [Microbacterium murale]GGD70108.1 sugar ABC transporter substrate-binding protein [Microbacterium murale]